MSAPTNIPNGATPISARLRRTAFSVAEATCSGVRVPTPGGSGVAQRIAAAQLDKRPKA